MTATIRGCCDACSCSLQCFQEGNCCPDVVQYEMETVKETCIRPQYLPYGDTNSSSEKSYYVIHKCSPEFGDMDIVKKCEVVPLYPRTLEDFVYILLVSKINSSLSYRNIYCGLCNGESRDNLLIWTVELICDSRNEVLTNSFDELLHVLNQEKRCNLIYRVPYMSMTPRVCNWGYITACNQTGTMVSYNDTLDEMCGAFTSVYTETYRNVFCYLCNNNITGIHDCPETAPRNGLFDVFSFTAILDFGLLTSTLPPQPSDTACSSIQKYDSYKAVCRNLTCATGSIYVEGSCKRKYASEATRSYEVFFRLKTVHDICVEVLDLFGTELSTSLVHMFEQSSIFRGRICSFNSHLMSGTQECDHRNSSSISYVLVNVGFYFSGVHSVDQVLSELSLMDNISITIGNNKLTLTIDSHFYGNSVVYEDPRTKGSLLELSNNLTVSKSCMFPVRHMRVTPLTYCPRLLLSPDEYSVTFHQGSICFDTIHLCLHDGTYERKWDGFEICADNYFDHVYNLPRDNICDDKDSNVLDVLATLSIVCTSISIFFLILTVFTYGLFKSLRTTPGKNNMLLSINLIIAQCLYQFGVGQTTLGVGCVVIGALVHFFWLSVIVWMNICSFHMFRVFSIFRVKTLSSLREEKKHMIVYILCSVIVPLLVVATNVLVSLVASNWTDFGYGGCICYISSKHMLLYTFVIPIGVIILLNIVCFVIVVIAIRRSQQSKLSSNQDQISILVYLKLSCLTGFSWMFGFLYTWLNLEFFGYMFIILTAGQGLFIFLSFICSKRVLKLYRGLLKCSSNSSKYSSGAKQSRISNLRSTSQNESIQNTKT
ncbi:uncharacterized protein [Argopecten irradians]|uniref:uncharacterized protein n=1 Tax=Argopecten irradians TaxID=31199 RepID=UPI003716BC89